MAPFALLSGRRLAQNSELASPLVGKFVSARFLAHGYWNERELDSVSATTSAIFARSTESPATQIPQLPSTTVGLIGFICFLVAGILSGCRMFYSLYVPLINRLSTHQLEALPMEAGEKGITEAKVPPYVGLRETSPSFVPCSSHPPLPFCSLGASQSISLD
jgi:hypothetical protein